MKYFSSKIIRKMKLGVPDLFSFFEKALYEVKANGLKRSFNIFRWTSTWRMIKTNYIKFSITDPEICSILVLWKRVWERFLHHFLCIIFQQKCFSCYIVITDQISLFDCRYFLRCWAMRVLPLFVNQVVTS